MERKIGATVLIFCVLQISILLVCYKIFNADSELVTSFLIHIVLWHILLLLFLILYKSEFINVKTNEALGKINLANKITLFRISSVPTVAFLLRGSQISNIKIVLAIFLIIIFFTDFFDGLIARKYNQETKIGAMLDSMADYSLLFLVSVVYYQMNILPVWFFYLILGRLTLQAIGVTFFMLLKHPVEIKSTIGGKITIASAMFLYTVKLSKFFVNFPPAFNRYVLIAEQVTGVVIFLFAFEKIIIFYHHWKNLSTSKSTA